MAGVLVADIDAAWLEQEPVPLFSDLVEPKHDHDAPLWQELDRDAPVYVPHQGRVEIGVV